MIAPARRAAYDILRAVNSGRADLPFAMTAARDGLPDERDRALASEIATGTLRWQGALDHLIAHFARRHLDRLDPEVLDILRLSAYQLLNLSRIPPAAAINEGVELARHAGKRSAMGLVNAVLRSIDRHRESLPLPPEPAEHPDGAAADEEQELDFLSVTLSHPRWLVRRWRTRYGFRETADWARFNNTPAPLALCVNTLKTTTEDLVVRLAEVGVSVARGRYAPHALLVTGGNPLLTPLATQGLFTVQDEASQLVTILTGVAPNERVLDACAAPGGKTVGMAARMGDHGLIVAMDVRRRRLSLLRAAVAASGTTIVQVAQNNLRAALPFGPIFDCVLLDAPCSGLGTIRRDPEVRWRRQEADLPRFAGEQLRMLHRAAEGVRVGGRLVYATCSSEPEEDEEVVIRFLATASAFRLGDPRALYPDLPDPVAAVLDTRGRLRTLPHLHRLEAFFGAVMSRTHG